MQSRRRWAGGEPALHQQAQVTTSGPWTEGLTAAKPSRLLLQPAPQERLGTRGTC